MQRTAVKGATKLVEGQSELINAKADQERALVRYGEARLDRIRIEGMLDDAQNILDGDQRKRNDDRLALEIRARRTEEEARDLEVEQRINAKRRLLREAEAELEYERGLEAINKERQKNRQNGSNQP